jgi:glutamine synthetase
VPSSPDVRQGARRAPERVIAASGLRRAPRNVPGSLEHALENLEKDHEFLLKGDVFTPSLIETWIGYKNDREIDQMRLRPHPWEFALYYDV